MTDRELLELILEKISAMEPKVSKIQIVVEEIISETHGYARKDMNATDL